MHNIRKKNDHKLKKYNIKVYEQQYFDIKTYIDTAMTVMTEMPDIKTRMEANMD